jgi:glucosyl-3-phosphoglycerate synthase
MSDFHQSGVITTFHRLGKYDLEAIETTLIEYTKLRPVSLVLPCLYSELHGPALRNIVQHLR